MWCGKPPVLFSLLAILRSVDIEMISTVLADFLHEPEIKEP